MIQEALKNYHKALLIHKEIGNRAMEATTLNNIGRVYHVIGQPQEALKNYREALSIHQEVGNRAGEATTLHNIACSPTKAKTSKHLICFYRHYAFAKKMAMWLAKPRPCIPWHLF
jgi:tetratricopeptide (TPR) repeat protein